MRLKRIKNIHDSYFEQAWRIYEHSFPIEERRLMDSQEKIMKHRDYHFELIFNGELFIGFIAWWQFETFRYIEHFATDPKYRGKGYGKSILEQFISKNDELVILEVELPKSSIDKRRIEFYRRLNFKLNEHEYFQEAFRPGDQLVQLNIMTYPKRISAAEVQEFKRKLKEAQQML